MCKRWITGDHHFGHSNIIRYANRPFPDVRVMNEEMERLWNATVDLDDEVWHLGDFGFMAGCDLPGIFNRLHGTKYLIRGSHDRGPILTLGWEQVIQGHYILDGITLVHEGGAFMRAAGADYADRPIFSAHVHDIYKISGNILNCGVDVWSFLPLSWETAVAYWNYRFAYWKDNRGQRCTACGQYKGGG